MYPLPSPDTESAVGAAALMGAGVPPADSQDYINVTRCGVGPSVWFVVALLFGGLFWVIDFVLIILNGVLTGSLPADGDVQLPLYLRVGLRLFVLSIPILNFGLGMLATQMRARSPKLTVAALLFMTIALLLSSINLVTISGLAGTPTFNDTFMGLSIFATAIATGFLSAVNSKQNETVVNHIVVHSNGRAEALRVQTTYVTSGVSLNNSAEIRC